MSSHRQLAYQFVPKDKQVQRARSAARLASALQVGAPDKIRLFMTNSGIERIAIIEDFVGSGEQLSTTIEFVCDNFLNEQIMFCPLIICPEGDAHFLALQARKANLTYEPVLRLPPQVFLEELLRWESQERLNRMRGISAAIAKNCTVVSESCNGFMETGSLTAMHTIALTILIFDLGAIRRLEPLFPRIRRA